jgi:hypothetical protein
VAKTDSFSSLSIPQLIIFRQVGLWSVAFAAVSCHCTA